MPGIWASTAALSVFLPAAAANTAAGAAASAAVETVPCTNSRLLRLRSLASAMRFSLSIGSHVKRRILAPTRQHRRYQNLIMTPAPQTTSRVRRSGNQTPPSFAQPSAAIGVPLLQTRLAGTPVLPNGGVTPPGP